MRVTCSRVLLLLTCTTGGTGATSSITETAQDMMGGK